MKVLIADPLSNEAITKLKEEGIEVEDLSQVDKKELINKVKGFDIMVVRSATKVRKEMIDNMDKMKLIIRGGVGIDNIDVEYANNKGIKVVNTPSASSISVAELVLAHMLALARKIVRGTEGIREGRWEKKVLKGVELYGKVLGIIGVGRIGREVAKRGKAFGMKVIGYDPYVESVEGVKLVSLEELLREADFISIHTPLTNDTKHLIGKKELSLVKSTVILINCARGGVVDEEALISKVKEGKIMGVGLDVFEEEPPRREKINQLENATFTPHIGAATYEAQERIGEEVVKLIRRFKNGNN